MNNQLIIKKDSHSYYSKHRKYVLEKMKRYYSSHKEMILAKARLRSKLYRLNPEKKEHIKYLKKLWRERPENKLKLRNYQLKYWANPKNREKHNIKRRIIKEI